MIEQTFAHCLLPTDQHISHDGHSIRVNMGFESDVGDLTGQHRHTACADRKASSLVQQRAVSKRSAHLPKSTPRLTRASGELHRGKQHATSVATLVTYLTPVRNAFPVGLIQDRHGVGTLLRACALRVLRKLLGCDVAI